MISIFKSICCLLFPKTTYLSLSVRAKGLHDYHNTEVKDIHSILLNLKYIKQAVSSRRPLWEVTLLWAGSDSYFYKGLWYPGRVFNGGFVWLSATHHPGNPNNPCCLSKEYFWHNLPQGCKANARAGALFCRLICFALFFSPSGVNYPIMLIGVPLEAYSVGSTWEGEGASASEAATYVTPHKSKPTFVYSYSA